MTEKSTDPSKAPVHPYWCDDCGKSAPFKIRGCGIPHMGDCPRSGEDPERVYQEAVDYCRATGETIP